MSQPVKLSDSLVLDARLVAAFAKRSIAGQIEFWATLGRAIEPFLRGREALALCKTGESKSLSVVLEEVDSDLGRQRVRDYLETKSFPHYEPSERAGLLVRIDADGKRTLGRFVHREFVPSDEVARKSARRPKKRTIKK